MHPELVIALLALAAAAAAVVIAEGQSDRIGKLERRVAELERGDDDAADAGGPCDHGLPVAWCPECALAAGRATISEED